MNNRNDPTIAAINWAIRNGGCLEISYRDVNGVITHREIEPITWLSAEKVSAFCRLRQANRIFRIENIVHCRRIEDDQQTYLVNHKETEHIRDQSLDHLESRDTTLTQFIGHELEDLQVALNSLVDRLADEELFLATLEAEVNLFQRKYITIVGTLIAKLDNLEAKIAELLVKLNPEDGETKQTYEKKRERSQASWEEAQTTNELPAKNKTAFKPSQSIKSLYREIAKRVHPDLGVDEQDRDLRNGMMIEANRAYEDGDEEGLKNLLKESGNLGNGSNGSYRELEIARLKRKIIQLEERLQYVRDRELRVQTSEMYLLKFKVEEAELNGEDILSQMTTRLKYQIKKREEDYRTLFEKLVHKD